MAVILKVFPNTGHQYFTRPLSALVTQKKEPELLKLVQQHWRFSPWSRKYPWLRFALDQRENQPVITIAVETNLGTPSRGTLFNVEACGAEPEQQEGLFPYAAHYLERPTQGMTIKVQELELGGSAYEVDVQIVFQGEAGKPVDVDLIVDLGNTRTAAVLLESSSESNPSPLSNRVWPLQIGPRGRELDSGTGNNRASTLFGATQTEMSIVDSWLVLHEGIFAHLEPRTLEQRSSVMCRGREHFFQETQQKGGLLEYYAPHAFVELSPALIGGGRSLVGAARTFANARLGWDYRFFLSSPKRYVWSLSRQGIEQGTYWFQMPNPESDEAANGEDFVQLRGLIRWFMSTDGRDLHTQYPEEPNGNGNGLEESVLKHLVSDDLRLGKPDSALLSQFQSLVSQAPPSYSYSDAICWFALSLLEAAYRQINSEAYLSVVPNNIVPRRLRYIRVTCPAAWTIQEQQLYFVQWQRAINLFTMSRFARWNTVDTVDSTGARGERPSLCREQLDEAVCSQLPILYAEIQALGGQANRWIDLLGDNHGVVVMNLDIGGGTTDLAVIRYGNQDTIGARLKPKLLFRDGYRIAGDMLVKKVIEKIIIPAWFKASAPGRPPGAEAAKSLLRILFAHPRDPIILRVPEGGSVCKRLARVVRLLFIPLANLLLQRLSNPPAKDIDAFASKSPEPSNLLHDLSIRDCINEGVIDPNTLADLNSICSLLIGKYLDESGWSAHDRVFSDEAVLKCNLASLEHCVDDVFGLLFEALAALVAQYSCQLLIVSGKPSEIPRVRELLVRNFPLLPQRIIQAKNYPAGDWYPFKNIEGRILDAKTCTVVGAALYQDSKYGNLEGFSIQIEEPTEFQVNAWWGLIPNNGAPRRFFDERNLLFRPGDYPDPGKARRDVLTAESRAVTLNLKNSHWIGRQLVKDDKVQPAPVYKLTWKPAQAHRPDVAEASIVFRWRSIRGKGDLLEVASVASSPGSPPITTDEVHLELNTLMEEEGEFWLDKPKLEVNLA